MFNPNTLAFCNQEPILQLLILQQQHQSVVGYVQRVFKLVQENIFM
jgi:hypothetical protein